MEPLWENAIHNERFVKVICVGAGASGLCLAYKLQRNFRNLSLKVYEKNPEVGGTWYENRYPGCACDVPSHNYTYSFEPKLDYSSVYAESREIKGYFEDFALKYSLFQYIQTSHVVRKAVWLEDEGEWQIEVEDLSTEKVSYDKCHILIHATGYLNNPSWPSIANFDGFSGIKLHSACWDENVSLQDKEVLIIGSGSSAVQILPTIQPIVKRAKIVIRSPTWLLPDISSESRQFTEDEIESFRCDPGLVAELRKNNERTMNSIFSVYVKNSILQNQCKDLLKSSMRSILNDEEMEEKLIPDFSVGCKRVIPSGLRFLKALKKENVEIIHGAATAFTATGCLTSDARHHTADIIICATGFDTSYIPRYPVLARGLNLQTEWARSVSCYMGIGVDGFPNTFTLLGPYTPVSNGPTLVAVEAQVDYVCGMIDRYQVTQSLRSMCPSSAACADFAAHVASAMQKMVWTDACRNAHNNHAIGSRTPTTWPGSTLHYLEALRDPRYEDWDFVHGGNRFSWLGDGISQTEWDPTADLAYYIRDRDDGRQLSTRGRNMKIAKTGTRPERMLHQEPKLGSVKVSDTRTMEMIRQQREGG
ncbi:FAD/NAD(P)-binding domain-containing protein [Xylaria acuta]|nr:FAD/NAD(P)-binding domain-containing protein [Xylaria acuta]